MTAAAALRENWLPLVAAGDPSAYRYFYEQYWPQVYGTALHLTRSPELAKDLAQDIFIKVWEGRGKLAQVQNIEAYIYTVSRNLVIDTMRKKVFDPANIDFLIQYFQTPTSGADEQLEYKELEQAMKNAVDQLSGKVKQVFLLSRTEGLTHEQIAERLQISIHSSKTYAVRALREIRNWLAAHDDRLIIAIYLFLHLASYRGSAGGAI